MNDIDNKLNRRPSLFESIANIAAINHYRAKHSYMSPLNATDDEILRNIECVNKEGHLPGKSWSHYGCRTFRSPNNHPTGYWNVLKYIASDRHGFKRREIHAHFNLKSMSMQLDNLEYAGLIRLDRKYTHKFTVTDFGKAYISAVICEFYNADFS